MTLPLSAAEQAFCEVSVIDSGSLQILLGQLIASAAPDEMTTIPCLSFVLRHSRTRDTLLFDLGIRPDPESFRGARETMAKMGMVPEGRDLPAALEKGGLSRADVKYIAISHIHFDHTGVPRAFPNATFLLGSGSKHLIEALGPEFEGTMHDIDVPLERTRFLDPSAPDWQPVGPLPRAYDLYGDGSLYIIGAPGHVPGHINVLARTSSDGGWVYLAGDSAHDWRLITGEEAIGHHVHWGCLHEDPREAQENIRRINALLENPRVKILLAHDTPFANANAKDGRGYWPDKIVSL